MPKSDKVSFIAIPEMLGLAESVRRAMAEKDLGVRDVIPIEIKRFADGITLPKILESIRRTEVYLFYAAPLRHPDLGLGELGKILNATHFGSPRSIKVVLPYLWEGRADRKSEARVSTNVKELAKLIEHYPSVNGLFTFDLHAEQIVLAFDHVPIDDLKGQILLAEHALKVPGWTRETVGVVAPDVGSVKRAEKFAKRSGFPFKGLIYKERTEANTAKAKRYIGDPVKDLHIILPDDMIDTAGTILGAAAKLRGEGALDITACTTHWVGSPKREVDPESRKNISAAEEKFRLGKMRVIALDTVPRPAEYLEEYKDFLTVISCKDMLADAIMASLTSAGSVSRLSE